jgi:hypothetical protein
MLDPIAVANVGVDFSTNMHAHLNSTPRLSLASEAALITSIDYFVRYVRFLFAIFAKLTAPAHVDYNTGYAVNLTSTWLHKETVRGCHQLTTQLRDTCLAS